MNHLILEIQSSLFRPVLIQYRDNTSNYQCSKLQTLEASTEGANTQKRRLGPLEPMYKQRMIFCSTKQFL